ncbi:hypothetical protein [Algiphilus sp.]|uniref:hypothetical protein n=1 Tax=Algiphilus sp. TaxID=1872431 RepID=UPI003B522E13
MRPAPASFLRFLQRRRPSLRLPLYALTVLLLMVASPSAPAQTDGAALSQGDVRQWLELRIETARLQRRMARQADAYDDLPLAFAEKRRALLDASGYGAARFDAHADRIWGAVSAINETENRARERADADAEIQRYCAPDASASMDMPADSAEEQRALIAEMRAMGVPEEQLAKMQTALAQMPSAEETASALCRGAREQRDVLRQAHEAQVTMTQRDWPAVRPWLDALQHFEDWYASNRSDPPVLR